jgi:hypothetical protein
MDEFRNPSHTPAPVTSNNGPAVEPQPEFAAPAKGKKSKLPKSGGKRTVLAIIVLLILIVAVAAAVFFWNKYNDSQKQVEKLSNSPTNTAQEQTNSLINSVGKLTELPTGETPTIATVTDVTKLAGQPFFANAKNGDKVLIYTQAKEAYLYRPSTNKIINIAPVNLGSSSTPSSTTSGSSTTSK